MDSPSDYKGEDHFSYKLLSLFKKIVKHRLNQGFDFFEVKRELIMLFTIEAYLYQVRDYNNHSSNRANTLFRLIRSFEQSTSWNELKSKLVGFSDVSPLYFLIKKLGRDYGYGGAYPFHRMFQNDRLGHQKCFYRSDYYTLHPSGDVGSWYSSNIKNREGDLQFDTGKLVKHYFKQMEQNGIGIHSALKPFVTFCQHEADMTSLRNDKYQEDNVVVNIGHRVKSLVDLFEACKTYNDIYNIIKKRMEYRGGFSGLAFPVMALMEKESIEYKHLLTDECPFNRFLFNLHLSCFYNPKWYGIKEPEV